MNFSLENQSSWMWICEGSAMLYYILWLIDNVENGSSDTSEIHEDPSQPIPNEGSQDYQECET